MQRDGGWAVDDLIKETDEEQRIRLLKSEPMVQDGCDFTLEQQVSHPELGNGVIMRLFKSTGCAAVECPDGSRSIVKLAELTPIEAGEPEPTPAAQSDLRKRGGGRRRQSDGGRFGLNAGLYNGLCVEVREALHNPESKRGWKAALADRYGIEPHQMSRVVKDINAALDQEQEVAA